MIQDVYGKPLEADLFTEPSSLQSSVGEKRPPELVGGDAVVQHGEAVRARLFRPLYPVVPPTPHCAPIVRPHLCKETNSAAQMQEDPPGESLLYQVTWLTNCLLLVLLC